MKFALVSGIKSSAQPGLAGVCPGCGVSVFSKCGKVRVHHWAHSANSSCPAHKEETLWHRSWKNRFPEDCQEVFHLDSTGEKHFADVKTESGYVLEFQHSTISDKERESRNEVYKKIVWVIHLWRKREMSHFETALSRAGRATDLPNLRIVPKLLSKEIERWSDPGKPILFDSDESFDSWLMLPFSTHENVVLLVKMSNEQFVAFHESGASICEFSSYIEKYAERIRHLFPATKPDSSPKPTPIVSPKKPTIRKYPVVWPPRQVRRQWRL